MSAIIITLKAARVNRDLTLIEAAKYLGISKDTLRKYEADSTNLPYALILKMSSLYEIAQNHLFFGNTDQYYAQFKPLPSL